MQLIGKLLISLGLWIIVSTVFSGFVIFYANNILSKPLNWSYSYFFWTFFFVGGIAIIATFKFVQPWTSEYQKFLEKGLSKEVAFNIACGNVKHHPPRWLLQRLTHN